LGALGTTVTYYDGNNRIFSAVATTAHCDIVGYGPSIS
jgi:hypothetical protein